MTNTPQPCWICGKEKGQPPERCPGHYSMTDVETGQIFTSVPPLSTRAARVNFKKEADVLSTNTPQEEQMRSPEEILQRIANAEATGFDVRRIMDAFRSDGTWELIIFDRLNNLSAMARRVMELEKALQVHALTLQAKQEEFDDEHILLTAERDKLAAQVEELRNSNTKLALRLLELVGQNDTMWKELVEAKRLLSQALPAFLNFEERAKWYEDSSKVLLADTEQAG